LSGRNVLKDENLQGGVGVVAAVAVFAEVGVYVVAAVDVLGHNGIKLFTRVIYGFL
jgi:hypothetical protein